MPSNAVSKHVMIHFCHAYFKAQGTMPTTLCLPSPGTLTQVQNSALDPANNSDCCDQTVPILQQIVRGVWPALCHIMSCDTEQLSQQQVLAATQQALLDIEEVVADESVLYGSNSRQGSQQQGIEAQLSGLANNMQRYTLRVNPHVIAQEIQQVLWFAEVGWCIGMLGLHVL